MEHFLISIEKVYASKKYKQSYITATPSFSELKQKIEEIYKYKMVRFSRVISLEKSCHDIYYLIKCCLM